MSIAAAIFADSQARVFRWVFGQPGRSYHMSELRRLTALVAERRDDFNEPGLQGVIDEIDLRAQVELAKLEHAA